MNSEEYDFLQAEKNTLIQLIADAPAHAVISRSSLQARLDKVESLLMNDSMSDPQSPDTNRDLSVVS